MSKVKAGRQTVFQTGAKRKAFSLLSIALLVAMFAVAPSRVSAQVECLSVCEAQLVQCIRNGGSFNATCLQTYDACVDACLGGAAAILE
jgi:hypothetical protein